MYGLAKKMESSSLPNWGEADRVAASMMTSIVGALENEVAVMGNLTMNLHVLMASFYRPFGNRTQVILERDAFSSDFVNLFLFGNAVNR
jgi:kynureninase